ncbi:MAG: helicase-exonuclease AddAB subunit AddA [Phycisphaerae bacterium]
MNWTPEQRTAIETIDRGVLVSAGAGSGKTGVLAERCVHLVCDAQPRSSIDRLLVVTFTDAAAAEMRSRIGAALNDRLRAGGPGAARRLSEQLALLDAAPISTIHAFCRRVLARFFAPVGLDPGFRVLDGHEARLLRAAALDDLLATLHRGDGPLADGYDALVDAFGRPRDPDGPLCERVDALDRFLESVVDRDDWLEAQLARYAAVDPARLSPFWHAERRALLTERLALIASDCRGELARLARGDVLLRDEFARRIETIAAALEPLVDACHRAGSAAELDAVCERIAATEMEHAPRRPRELRGAADEPARLFEAAQDRYRALGKALAALRKTDARFTDADWAEGLARVAPHVRTLVGLVRAFRSRYDEAKRAAVACDFADLERLTLRLLSDERGQASPVATWLAERFDHVLVDEYQDVNPVQDAILRRIGRSDDARRANNLFVVGDVKQSIYRFRLAEAGLFVQAAERARAPASAGREQFVALNRNFRSHPGILSFVNALFERLMSPELGGVAYDDAAALRPPDGAAADVPGAPRVELHLLAPLAGQVASAPDDDTADDAAAADDLGGDSWERVEREAFAIAERILALRAADPGARFGDIAVLMRSPRHAAPRLVRVLERRGIPVQAELASGFFAAREVRDVLTVLRLIDNPRQDVPLAAYLRSPLAPRPLDDSALARIRLAGEPGAPFHEAAIDAARRGPRAALRSVVFAALAALERWRELARRRPLTELLDALLDETGYAGYVAALSDAAARAANLAALREVVARFATFRRQGVGRFLEFMGRLADAAEDLGAAAAVAAGDDRVRVMSIHSAKGLEFPVVFVAELGKEFNLRDQSAPFLFERSAGLGLRAADARRRITYPTLAHRRASEMIRRQALAEEQRVLYVALTRAKERLILVGTAPRAVVAECEEPDDAGITGLEAEPGPLPLATRLKARSFLDWLLAARRSFTGDQRALLSIERYSADEISSWRLAPRHDAGVTERLTRLARLGAAPSPPAGGVETAGLDALLARLAWEDPRRPLSRLPAVVAASALKRRFDALRDPDDPPAPLDRPTFAPRWAAPLADSVARPADDALARGTATHRVLQCVELARDCDLADLRQQLAALVAAGRIDRPDAERVDLDALAWFFGEPLGARLRRAGDTARREAAFVNAVSPAEFGGAAVACEPADRVLVRGIVDCFFEEAGGLVLLDYKTDPLSPGEVAARAEHYRPQLAAYARAVADIWRQPVRERWLVFLAPRQIVAV